jgi:hypothetical protein
MIAFQSTQERILANGWARLAGSAFPYSVQYFQTLRRVARVIARGPRSAALRAAIVTRWGGDAEPFTSFRELEMLGVQERYRLFDLVSRVMHAWPERFVAAALAAKLWQSWANRDSPVTPFAYADTVSRYLARPTYSPSLEEVQSAAAYLRRHRPGFTRKDLIRLVGDSEAVVVVFAKERRRRRSLMMKAIRRSLS